MPHWHCPGRDDSARVAPCVAGNRGCRCLSVQRPIRARHRPVAMLADTLQSLEMLGADGKCLQPRSLCLPATAAQLQPRLGAHFRRCLAFAGRAARRRTGVDRCMPGAATAAIPKAAPPVAGDRARPAVVPILLARQLALMRAAANLPQSGRRALAPTDPRHPRAARQPARHLAAEMGTGRPGIPPAGAGDLPADRRPARRQSARARGLHRQGAIHACAGAGGAGGPRGGRRPAQAHLQHLEEDAEENRRSASCTT